MSKGNYQKHETVPAYEAPVWVDEKRAIVKNGDVLKWSGKLPPPAIGTKISVIMNNLGDGTVRGYFQEYNWFGLLVEFHNPPTWWKKQNPDRPLGHVFGIEWKPLEK